MQGPSELSDANFRASYCYLLDAMTPCLRCGFQTAVYALALPAAHQWLYSDDESGQAGTWQSANAPAVLLHVEELSSAVAIRLRELAPRYRLGFSPASGASRWVNHCDHCDEPLEDDDLHCEPEAAFMPISPEAAHSIRLTEVRHPLEVSAADCASDAIWLSHVTRG
jgi:hypothetical protein